MSTTEIRVRHWDTVVHLEPDMPADEATERHVRRFMESQAKREQAQLLSDPSPWLSSIKTEERKVGFCGVLSGSTV